MPVARGPWRGQETGHNRLLGKLRIFANELRTFGKTRGFLESGQAGRLHYNPRRARTSPKNTSEDAYATNARELRIFVKTRRFLGSGRGCGGELRIFDTGRLAEPKN